MADTSRRHDGWQVVRDATSSEVAHLPAPACGRYVVALEPEAIDGWAEAAGEIRPAPRRECLALVWPNSRGQETLGVLDRTGWRSVRSQRQGGAAHSRSRPRAKKITCQERELLRALARRLSS